MVRIVTREEIERVLPSIDLVAAMERAFLCSSRGDARTAAVGHLDFGRYGDACVKSGFLADDERFVVKVAGGFPDNAAAGRSTSQGLMVVLSSRTGETLAVLLDEGVLTDERTGAAGGAVARRLAPREPRHLAVIGAGVQARVQARYVARAAGTAEVRVWGRDVGRARKCAEDLQAVGLEARAVKAPEDAAREASVIVTATSARAPILSSDAVADDALVLAVGADAEGKRELDPALFARAALVVADSVEQCAAFGEVAHGIRAGAISRQDVVELGRLIESEKDLRAGAGRLVVADLTGVAVQDVVAACAVLDRLAGGGSLGRGT